MPGGSLNLAIFAFGKQRVFASKYGNLGFVDDSFGKTAFNMKMAAITIIEKNNRSFPCVQALFMNANQNSYESLFQFFETMRIQDGKQTLHLDAMFADEAKAISSALHNTCPSAALLLCYYHLQTHISSHLNGLDPEEGDKLEKAIKVSLMARIESHYSNAIEEIQQ
jgi:hypothetical protein